jgi:kynureninase
MTNIPSPTFLDRSDPLAHFRDRFHIPRRSDGSPVVYLCGNSLGLQPKSTRDYVNEVLDDWGALAVEGHFKSKHPWMPYHETLTRQTAGLVGALPHEVVVMNNLTVNLHLMLVSFYRPTRERHRIVIEANAFPSDRYAVESQIRFHGFDPDSSLVELQPRSGEAALRTEDIVEFLNREGSSVATVLLGGVNYYTGQAFEMEAITRAGHTAGCIVGFDLAHAAGNIVLKMHDWGADFAVWCSYKYLNAGPGSTAGCFVHERHAERTDLPRFAGWWGHNKQTRFLMGPDFDPIPGAEGWQLSNPAILPMAALRASMDIFDEAGMDRLRSKSVKLTGYLESLLLGNPDLELITPRDPNQRGAQLSIRVMHNARRVFTGLNDEGVICDWREPDVIRVAPVPLYNSYNDVDEFARTLAEKTEPGIRSPESGRGGHGHGSREV